jgi:NAD-dependent SIR2 family protein deacetylase
MQGPNLTVWHPEHEPDGNVVELHGNITQLVCPQCKLVRPARTSDLTCLKKCQPRTCAQCEGVLRFRIMLYDDADGAAITPEDVWDRFEEDMQTVDLIIWVGISFRQVRCRGRRLAC